MSNNEEARRFSLEELRNLVSTTKEQVNNCQADIDYNENPFIPANDKNDERHAYLEAKEKIEPLKEILPRLESLLFNFLIQEIKAGNEPELTEEEAQMIIDKYESIVDANARAMHYDEETYKSLGSSGNLENEDEFQVFDDAFNDLKASTLKFEENSKVLNYAQCFVPENKRK